MPAITLSSGKSFSADAGTSILTAGVQAQVSLPYSCKSGRCTTCKCKVYSGVTTALHPESGLTAKEKAEGWILSCVRSAETDLVLELEELADVLLPPANTLPCRINSIELLTPDVARVFLRLPPTSEFNFIPGQFIEIIGHGGIRRSYSLANADFSDRQLELHIRAVDGGAMSDYWFKSAKKNDLLRLNGPLGTFFLRDPTDTDLIFLATGTGIAPVKAIIESIPYLEPGRRPNSVTVLWGGRFPRDIYFDVCGLPGDHKFIATLSRADPNWNGARGYVQDALLALKPELSNATVYACGSDNMIHSARKVLIEAGLVAKSFYSDAFVCSGLN